MARFCSAALRYHSPPQNHEHQSIRFHKTRLVSSLWREEASLLSRNFHRRPRVGIETEARLQNWRKSAKSAELSRHGDGRWRNLGSSNKKVSHMPLKTFTSVFLALTLIAFAAEPSDENEEEWLRPRFLSPDGSLCFARDGRPGRRFEKERVELIELATSASGSVKRGWRRYNVREEGEIGLVTPIRN